MTARIDAIVEKAYKYLDRFYENYGEEAPKGKSPIPPTRGKVTFDDTTFEGKKTLVHCKRPGCLEIPRKGNRFCDLHFNVKATPKQSKRRPKPQPFSITNWTPPVIQVKEKLSLNIKGLSSREIVELIKKETGEAITVCVKSKQNVIRHAEIILNKKGMTLYE
jgi:hypothetical protein